MKSHTILRETSKAGMRLGIDRFHSFITYIGNPLGSYPVIHVAGTNGKGSIVRMLSSCLEAAGYRVGSYTSPHLQHINERIQIGHRKIDDLKLDRLLQELYGKSQQWLEAELQIRDEIPLTTFELLTAVAMQYFWEEKVDIAILEVGLGGRYDATNIVSPVLSLIASISLDHTDVLGNDEASIAAEKAGIIKENVPVIAGNLSAEALRSIRSIAHERLAALYVLGADIRIHPSQEGLNVSFLEQEHRDCPVPLLGSHQQENTALVISALQLLSSYFPISPEERNRGLLDVRYRGRMEWIDTNILIDCAHNEAGARQLGEYLLTMNRNMPRNLVLGVSREKDIRSIVLSLAPHFDEIFVIAADHYRAIPALELQEICSELRLKAQVLNSFTHLHQEIDVQTELLVICGSIFLVGEYLDWIEATTALL